MISLQISVSHRNTQSWKMLFFYPGSGKFSQLLLCRQNLQQLLAQAQRPHMVACVPKVDFLLSTLRLHSACVRAASVNIPSTHRHIPTYTPANISHALFSWIFLWMKPQCSKHSLKENWSSHRHSLSELSDTKENFNQHCSSLYSKVLWIYRSFLHTWTAEFGPLLSFQKFQINPKL